MNYCFCVTKMHPSIKQAKLLKVQNHLQHPCCLLTTFHQEFFPHPLNGLSEHLWEIIHIGSAIDLCLEPFKLEVILGHVWCGDGQAV